MSSDSPFPVPMPATGSARRADLDNLIRRELRVGDPSDAKQIAQALMQRYADSPTARSLVNEAKGLPFLQTVLLAPPPAPTQTATSLDLQQSKDDIEADLRELLTSNQLKDIVPELEGWAHAIRDAVSEGERSAVLAMDTCQRDKTFAIRRQLGDYARAARLAGSFKAGSREDFRNLAQSLDEAAAVLLVMMGEAIANTGIAGGRYLLQVPFSELQSRREAVLYALRNLMGSTQFAYGPNDLPRGLDAYRKLLASLEEQGQGDLRALLTEAELTRVMDLLIDRAGQGVSGLRALASTAQIDIQRFQRLLAAIRWNVDRAGSSPPLLALQEALGLFVDGFGNSGGIRLVNIARPAILRYGLYRSRPQGASERRLTELLERRGNIAALVDGLADCGCDDASARSLVLLDQGTYSLDRALDLYSVGVMNLPGKPEIRAAAHGQVIQQILARLAAVPALKNFVLGSEVLQELDAAGQSLLQAIDLAHAQPDEHAWMVEELAALWRHEGDARDTVAQLVGDSRALGLSFDGSEGEFTHLTRVPTGDVPLVLASALEAHKEKVQMPPLDLHIPVVPDASLAGLMEAKVHDVLLSSSVQYDSAKRLVRELTALESESQSMIDKAKGDRGQVQLRITPDGDEAPEPIAYTKKDAQEALLRLHQRRSAAETAMTHLRERRTDFKDTLRHIPFRTE